jgi:hypothetical protein
MMIFGKVGTPSIKRAAGIFATKKTPAAGTQFNRSCYWPESGRVIVEFLSSENKLVLNS